MSDKQKIAQQAKHLLQSGFVLVDVETTGFPTDARVEIIEIAILSHTGEVLLNTLVKPQMKIPYGASAVNQIYDEDVIDAPPFAEVYPQMSKWLNHQIVAAYNFTFEKGIFERVCELYNVGYLTPRDWYCPMRSYKTFRGLRKYAKLTEACRTESITIKNAHRALGDCIMTLELIRTMADSADE